MGGVLPGSDVTDSALARAKNAQAGRFFNNIVRLYCQFPLDSRVVDGVLVTRGLPVMH